MRVCHTEIDGDIAVIVIDNPPVNAGSHRVRQGLLAELASAGTNPQVRGVVILGAGANFYSGSDIKEFDGPLAEPQLPAVIATIEDLDVPVVAAISGLALGGGFELALGCDVRIGDPTAVVGLPETGLGIIPGAGGTVRLPRLVDAATALDMIGSAARIPAPRAYELGILDELVSADLRGRAVTRARSAPKRVLRKLPVGPFDATELDEVEARVLRRGRRRPHIREAAEAVRRAAMEPADDALRSEREVFMRLRTSEEARALRHLFFAERAAARALSTGAKPLEVRSVAVIGAGTMGRSIASALVLGGYRSVVTDTSADILDQASRFVSDACGRAGHPEAAQSLVATRDLAEAVAEADLVIDAVYEDMEVKRELFARLGLCVPAHAVLASNTSYLDLNAIAASSPDPTRVVGLHFFNPAHRNKLVEIVETDSSSAGALATVAAVARRLGKVAIRAHVGDGFVANRIYAAYRTQCEFLVEDGCSPEQVDAALTRFGFAMGPFAVADMSGLDIAWSRRRRLAADRPADQRYVRIPDRLCEAGRLGRKTGSGWYAYDETRRTAAPDPWVAALIAAEREAKGIAPLNLDDEEIVRRVICSMVIEAASLVNEGIAAQPSDIDVALVNGFAFPRWRGGPLWFASRQPETWLAHGLTEVQQSCPVSFPLDRGDTGGIAQVTHVLVGS